MIDIHTHILPHMDDGSSSTQETFDMLCAMHAQGVTRIAATPHFYADNEDPASFLARRDKAYEVLTARLADWSGRAHDAGRSGAPGASNAAGRPGHSGEAHGADTVASDSTHDGTEGAQSKINIIPGAEVRYFTGCGRTEEMDRFKLKGTDFILLELPDRHFTMGIIDDIMELKARRMRPILAHLNRYKIFGDEEFIEFCNEEGILIQLNTECVIDRHLRKRSIRLIAEERVQFLATDCHDTVYRKPNKKEALDIIMRATSPDFVRYFTENEEYIISGALQ